VVSLEHTESSQRRRRRTSTGVTLNPIQPTRSNLYVPLTASEMTYIVSGGVLNSTHSLTAFSHGTALNKQYRASSQAKEAN